jgi:hypothetical protein
MLRSVLCLTLAVYDREWRELLEKCASTAMSSKLIHSQKDFFKKMVVDAVLSLDDDLNEKLIGMKTVPGGALQVCKSTFIYFLNPAIQINLLSGHHPGQRSGFQKDLLLCRI